MKSINYLSNIDNKTSNMVNNLNKYRGEKGFLKYKNVKVIERYLEEINKIIPECEIEVRSFSENFIQSYFENMQQQSIDNNFVCKIIMSSNVKKKMDEDNKYAYKILEAILSTGITRNIDDIKRKLYEFNIFVKDNGELEVVTCMDADYKEMKREKRKLEQKEAIRKAGIKKKIKEVESRIYSHYLYKNKEYRLINRCEEGKNFQPYSYFLSQSSELKRLKLSLMTE